MSGYQLRPRAPQPTNRPADQPTSRIDYATAIQIVK
jgi:hypothetical protein